MVQVLDLGRHQHTIHTSAEGLQAFKSVSRQFVLLAMITKRAYYTAVIVLKT